MPADRLDPTPTVTVRSATLADVRPLRHLVLRAGKPYEATVSPDDHRPEMQHLAAIAGGRIVGVVSYFEQAPPGVEGRAFRFRGMAVDPAWQGRGVGSALVRALRNRARDTGVSMLWANGRDTAQSFYERVGFHIVGDGFLDDEMHLGHHVVVARLDQLRA